MLKFLPVCLLFFAVASLRGQDQERKLVDRLLKPDMTLQNSEQNKKFTADKSLVEKRAHVSAFYIQKKPNAKTFGGTRDFSAQPFADQRLAQTKSADLSSRTTSPARPFTTAASNQPRQSPDANKTRKTNNFAGNRPFLEEGKSQKSLSRKNPPLTIEQVRELLNKNK